MTTNDATSESARCISAGLVVLTSGDLSPTTIFDDKASCTEAYTFSRFYDYGWLITFRNQVHLYAYDDGSAKILVFQLGILLVSGYKERNGEYSASINWSKSEPLPPNSHPLYRAACERLLHITHDWGWHPEIKDKVRDEMAARRIDPTATFDETEFIFPHVADLSIRDRLIAMNATISVYTTWCNTTCSGLYPDFSDLGRYLIYQNKVINNMQEDLDETSV
jgi:hypothetical protein